MMLFQRGSYSSLGVPISSPILCEKSLELNKNCGGSDNFKASASWLYNFKLRHGIRELQIRRNKSRRFLDEKVLTAGDVYNADKTGVNWKSLPRNSLESCQESTARGFKVSKEKMTAMTCTKVAGTHKVPLLLIGKSRKPRCFKNIIDLAVT